LLFVYKNENEKDANLPNENNIKTKPVVSKTYKNENVYYEN